MWGVGGVYVFGVCVFGYVSLFHTIVCSWMCTIVEWNSVNSAVRSVGKGCVHLVLCITLVM